MLAPATKGGTTLQTMDMNQLLSQYAVSKSEAQASSSGQ
ncbi:hypothetical protein D187_001717 [Cystobacter fuscus DSM 2262]|uniref:Uncharacterized protein n=1 Tax=Cystobacter fuscus (strain ATCC 25194 / DSM 2262 / NBRC 100088 / M29) TaxID=1242864 RepID=S9P9J3_CYSF2|nr:hypothetical protein D187_001717 [Cystobacter fuscus DSM 2262]